MPSKQIVSSQNLDELIAEEIMYSSSHPKHDEKWQSLGPSDAAIARVALRVADAMRGTQLDPADAYLRGIADYRAAQATIMTVHRELS